MDEGSEECRHIGMIGLYRKRDGLRVSEMRACPHCGVVRVMVRDGHVGSAVVLAFGWSDALQMVEQLLRYVRARAASG